jgi:hypothetical protein
MPIERKTLDWGYECKSMDEEQRIIRGMATTPNPDRVGDVVEPLGLKFAPEIPLFLYHHQDKSVGVARLGAPTKKGVPFEAQILKVPEPGALRDRADEAWQMVKYGLIRAVSIGFQPVYELIEQLKSGGLRYPQSEVLELSLAPIPMNADARITLFKQLDTKSQAALGRTTRKGISLLVTSPGASGILVAHPGAVKLIPR